MGCRGVKLQLLRQYGSCYLQQVLGLECLLVADDSENGIEMVDPMKAVSFAENADFLRIAYRLR